MVDIESAQYERRGFEREVHSLSAPDWTHGGVPDHRVRRLIDADDPVFTDPFLIMGEDWMPHGAYAVHPHRGMETVTFVIDGEVDHFDSAGHRGVIGSGDAQWMTAGRGVLHEESAAADTLAHTLQLWINLPAAQKMAEPRYQDLRAESMPVWRNRGVEVRVFSGSYREVSAPTLNHVAITMLEFRLQSGAGTWIELPAPDNAFIFGLEGSVRVGASETPVAAGELAWFTRSDQHAMSQIRLGAGDIAARLLLFAGTPLREPVVFGGPFVMTTAADINQAFRDFANGRF